jgi:glutamate carboxypeptidase
MTSNLQAQSILPLLQFCQEHQAEMLETLKRMVGIESPSDNKAAVDRLGQFLAQEFERIGGKVTVDPQTKYGNHLKAEFSGSSSGKPVMLLGHFDTVWPLGTLAGMPFRMDAGRAYGPGVYDMKAGIVMMLFAVRAIQAVAKSAGKDTGRRPVIVLLDTDEEVGSATGRPLVEATARACEAVLVMEPAQGPLGHLKTSRKGVGAYTLRVHGQASHAGVDFEKGHSAIVELARQILEVAKFTNLSRGTTVNPGVIQGGTRSNVVAAEAWVVVDVRIAHAADAAELEQQFAALRPFDPHCTLEVSGGLNRPPMERSEGTARMFRVAQQLAQTIGMALDESSTGGGSDGNFTAAMGIPTLDGLGAVGEGAHAVQESIVIEELPRRAALLAGLVETL